MRCAGVSLVAVLCLAQSSVSLLEQKNWKAAAEAFRTDARAESQIGLGIALWGLGDRDGALSAFQRAAKADPVSATAQYNLALASKQLPPAEGATLLLGLLLQQGGQPDKAIAQYHAVLRGNPRSAEAHNWLGVAYLQKNSFSDAAAEFREAIRLKPNYVRAHNNLGSALAHAGDFNAAIGAFEAGLKYAPDDAQIRLNLGTALRSKGDADGALAQFRSLLRRNPDNAGLHYEVGQTLRQKGEIGGAVQEFERALELDPELREAYYGLGQALKQMAAAARRKTGAVRQTAPEISEQLRVAADAIGRGDWKQAREACENAVQAHPQSAEALNLLGFVLGRSGDLPGAIEKLTRAVALDANSAEAHYNLGVALWYHGERQHASAELDEALRLDPALGNACAFRGMVYRETGEPARARAMLERAIALNPQDPFPYVDLGVVFLRTGQLARALGQFEAGLNLPAPRGQAAGLDTAIAELRRAASGNPEAQNVLGRLLGFAGAPATEVMQAFEQALRLRPDYAEARNNLGLVYVQSGNDAKAAAEFREAIRLRPDYADAHQNLGAILTTSDPTAAVRELQRALALQPGSLKAQYNLAVAYGASADHGPAREIEQLEKVLAADPSYPQAEFMLGRMLLRQGKVEDAVRHLQTAVAQQPELGEAHYQLGLALTRAGRQADGSIEIQKGRAMIEAAERGQSANLDINEGKAALDRGDLDEAIVKLRHALATRPDAVEARRLLDVALEKQSGGGDDPRLVAAVEDHVRAQRFTEAEKLLRDYVQSHPKSAWGWYALGYCLYGQRRIGDSIQALAQSLQLDLKNAEAHKVLGRDLLLIGRFDAAQLEFEQGARLKPASAEMPYNLGKLYSIQDNWPAARQQFERALKLDPSFIEAYDGLGFALEASGDDTGAIANYEKANRLAEERKARFTSSYVNLSALYNRNNIPQAALEYARKALDVNPRSDRALFQMAKAYEKRGELPAAADALNRAVAINGRVSSYYYVLATVCRRLGKVEQSRQAMETFTKLERETGDLEKKRRELFQEEAAASANE